MTKITENTLLPISVLTGIAAVMYWLASLASQTAANAQNITELQSYIQQRRLIGDKMIVDIAVIKEKVDRIERAVVKGNR